MQRRDRGVDDPGHAPSRTGEKTSVQQPAAPAHQLAPTAAASSTDPRRPHPGMGGGDIRHAPHVGAPSGAPQPPGGDKQAVGDNSHPCNVLPPPPPSATGEAYYRCLRKRTHPVQLWLSSRSRFRFRNQSTQSINCTNRSRFHFHNQKKKKRKKETHFETPLALLDKK